MIRLRTGRVALFGAMLVAALLALLPMRLVLGAAGVGDVGLSARAAEGSVWAGRLRDTRAGGLDLGDLDAGVLPLGLLLGRARIALASPGQGAARTLSGAVMLSRHGAGVDALSASLPAAGLFPPLPVTQLDMEEVSVRFRDGGCERAEGRVRATLAGTIAGLPLASVMAGTARCDGRALLLPLASAAGTERADLRLQANGRYAADLVMRAPDPATAAKLAALGFTPAGGGYRLSIDGRF
jgi:general secretion pathway protein N